MQWTRYRNTARAVVLLTVLGLPGLTAAYTVVMDIDLDGDPSTINTTTDAHQVTARYVLVPDVSGEWITEIWFGIGGSFVECPGGDFDYYGTSWYGWVDDSPVIHGAEMNCVVATEIPADAGFPCWIETIADGDGFALTEPMFIGSVDLSVREQVCWPWPPPDAMTFVFRDNEYWIGNTVLLAQPWVDAAAGPLADAGGSTGAAWGDYDKDTYADLYICNYDGANRLLKNEGDGTFTDVTTGPVGDSGPSTAAVWADFNLDGYLDIYVVNDGAANRLLRYDYADVFTDVTAGPLSDSGSAFGVAWVDYDSDHASDLYISNNGQPNRLLHNDWDGNFSDQTPPELFHPGSSQGLAWGDYDNDGDLDLYLVTEFGTPNRLLSNDGAGVFTEVTTGPLGDTGGGQGAAWGDYDNDGDLDLYVTNWGTANRLLRNDGDNVFTDVTDGVTGDSGHGQSVAWVDYDLDGDLDLYIVNYDQPNKLLRNTAGNFSDASVEPIADTGPGASAAWADYDHDGDPDLYLAKDGEPNRLIRNGLASERHWLHIDPQGGEWDVIVPSTVIGARVRIVTGDLVQIREVSGGDGYLSQNSLVVEFGLGYESVVDTLEVWWPNGGYYRTTDVQADQIFWCHAVPTGVPPAGVVPAPIHLHPCYPNPFNPRTRLVFDLSADLTITLSIHELDGSLVRTLKGGTWPRGRHETVWDGRDDEGRSLPSGTYLVRLRSDAGKMTQKVMLIR